MTLPDFLMSARPRQHHRAADLTANRREDRQGDLDA
jgi:hypothetical protein